MRLGYLDLIGRPVALVSDSRVYAPRRVVNAQVSRTGATARMGPSLLAFPAVVRAGATPVMSGLADVRSDVDTTTSGGGAPTRNPIERIIGFDLTKQTTEGQATVILQPTTLLAGVVGAVLGASAAASATGGGTAKQVVLGVVGFVAGTLAATGLQYAGRKGF